MGVVGDLVGHRPSSQWSGPWPWVPTTTRAAPRDASTNAEAAPPRTMTGSATSSARAASIMSSIRN